MGKSLVSCLFDSLCRLFRAVDYADLRIMFWTHVKITHRIVWFLKQQKQTQEQNGIS